MYEPITTWHIVISGFLQTEGRLTGCLLLWRQLQIAYASKHTAVELRSWDSNWKDLAEVIWRFRPDDTEPLVYVSAYSWGAGYGFVKLAQALIQRGIHIQHAVLSDPVYRSRLVSFRWRSLFGTPTIVVPRNVREVSWWFQRQDRPYGSLLKAEREPSTFIHDGIEVDRSHVYMDDLEAWHARALSVARVAEAIQSEVVANKE